MSIEKFKVGCKVVHPDHGAGSIKSVSEENFFGFSKTYLIIEFFSTGSVVKIPVDEVLNGNIPLREVLPRNILEEKLKLLGQDVGVFKESYQRYLLDVKSGSIDKLIEVINELWFKRTKRQLHSRENKLLKEAINLLASEISIAFDVMQDEARSMILQAVGASEEDAENLFDTTLKNARGIKWVLKENASS